MIIQPQVNTGIDSEILRIQNILDTLSYEDLHVYGRIYRNLGKEGDYNAEAFTGDREYKQIFTDDTKGGIFGVHVIDREVEFMKGKASIEIIFTGRLDKMTLPIRTERYDEEVINNTVQLLVNNSFLVNEIKTGVADVFADFETDNIKFRDMQPNLVFSLALDINYELQNNC